MAGDSSGKPTNRGKALQPGNRLFEQAVFTLGFDAAVSRRVIAGALGLVGATPATVTLAEMGESMPEIERRLVLVAPHETYAPRLNQLHILLMEWTG